MRQVKRCEGNLPTDVTGFIGRRRELRELRTLLTESRLMTLTGVGGVGKTRMALKVAAESRRAFRDGVWFVELAVLQDASLLADTVASALGVVKHTTRAPLEQLADYLADKHMLVILDNCEHLSDACATLVGELLRTAPMVRFLITSRHSLGVLGERIFTVPPMSTPNSAAGLDASSLNEFDAVALLCARASDSGLGFHVTDENSLLVARLCERLDGIPLAIELAAARLRTLTVADVLDRLDRRFQLLSAGNSAALPRHQTLQALIDWSYALCSPKEQALWSRLSVFSGSFSLAAVEAVCAGEGLTADEMLDLVEALVRKSILITERSGEQMRYRLLETVREYGSAQLATTDASTRLQRTHGDYFGRLAERSFTEWCGPEQATWVARLREDYGNLRAAFDRCIESGRGEQACALAAALQWYWIAGGSLGEGRRWLGQALAIADPRQPRPAHAAAMWVDAYLALLRGELAAAGAQLDEAERLAGVVDAPDLPSYLAQLRGMAALFSGDLNKAKKCYECALAGHEERGDTVAVVSMLFQLAVVCLFTGGHDHAAALCERSLRLSARYGERWAASYALWALALNKWSVGDYAGAGELARESLRLKRDFGDHLGIAHMIELLAWIAASDGRFVESARMLGAAHTIWHSLGTSMAAFGQHLADCHTATEKRVREALGTSAADALTTEGAALGTDLAMADLTGIADTPDALEDAAGCPLTARELEVAGLVSRGMTNRQIAAELVLSSRTIDSHVQHILTKFGFTSRSQIAGWFAQQSSAPNPNGVM
ncbi:LuxR C-terminal-related transcriptional regulator [Mycobacterium sp. 663a-19]|uniref:ATP-binding protein n=1 Tax=Mycobacterium sp. 663a-19 TaxID=2986148 RepID=UPI002D1EDAAF|nr:LuxR C-terminal-related transcriptional regulator [Mycobacterium sp. 663a-19]MEB3980786.1 LuxR C-terminal-related transcriptional regulator [Mycobacterium sp. 663a-19]